MAETVHEEMLRRAAAIIDRAELTGEVVSWLQDYRTWIDGGSPREGFEYVWVPEGDPRWDVLPEPDSRYRCRGLLTARSLGRRAVGIEADEKYCEAAARRLAELDLFGAVS